MVVLGATWLHDAAAIAVLVGAAAVAWAFWRGAGGTALTTVETANRVLEGELRKAQAERERLLLRVTTLETRTDFAMQLKPIHEAALAHEQRANERHEKTLKVLDLIAGRLGADAPENGET